MFKHLTAVAVTALALGACSMQAASSEDLGTQQAALTGGQCGIGGLEWKPFLAHLAYDAAEDFGRWEFTTDLYHAGDGTLQISSTGYAQCASRGRSGCPSMTAGLSAQQGGDEIRNSNGQVIMNPMTIRTNLVQGFDQQVTYENFQSWMDDPRESAPYNHFQSATKTGLPHTVSLTNCAATIYADPGFSGASQCLRAGNYRMADLKAVGNDLMSSIRVRSGMKVTMYLDDRFSGTSMVATADSGWLGSFNDQVSSLVIAATDTSACSAIDTFKVSVTSGDWTKIRGKLLTLGWSRGVEDLLDLRLDLANNTIDVDPFNVDFVPPSQIGGTTYGVNVLSPTAETWRSTEDPSPSIFPIGAACKKKPYGGSSYLQGVVKSLGSYRYCWL